MLKIKIHSIKNATEDEKNKYKMAASAMLLELNGEFFWKLVSENWDKMTQKNNISYTEYYNLIMSGQSKYETVPDNEIDLYVEYYYKWGKVVGYTRPSTIRTWFNRKFGRINIPEFAGHIYHEHCGHNYGFDHYNGDTNSLVYQTGYLMRDAVAKRMDIPLAKKIKRSIFRKLLGFFNKWF